jgi:Mg-chelatase subunit ChlD
VSPEVGQLDEDALDALFDADAAAAGQLLVDLVGAVDPVLRARARKLAGRLALRTARGTVARARGVGTVVSRVGAEGDLDLDASIERAGGRPRDASTLVARTWAAPDQALMLCIDRSGSMRGVQVLVAATAAAAVLLAADGRSRAGVLAFGTDALVLRAPAVPRGVDAVVDDVLSLRGHGVTDLALGLTTAREELASSHRASRIAVVLSDCLATTGADPTTVLGGFDRVHVLGTSDDPASVAAGQRLARAGGGRHRVVTSLAELAPALTQLLS